MTTVNVSNVFKGIIGQNSIKPQLEFYQRTYPQDRLHPNLLLCGGRGQGKTKLARAIARGLHKYNDNGDVEMQLHPLNPTQTVPVIKTYVEVNCASIRTLNSFFDFAQQHVVDKDCTILFDEASEIPHKVTMAMLSILQPNSTHRNTYVHNGYPYEFDFRHQTFLFATTEPNKIFHALLDRLTRVDLEEYTLKDLCNIIKNELPDVQFDESLDMVATVLRGNARAAQQMATQMSRYLGQSKVFMTEDWQELKKILGIHPLGLNNTEISVLRYVAAHPNGVSLTALSAKTGMSRESLQKDVELYLQKHDLLTIETTGRMLTAKGFDYLKNLDAQPVVPSAPVIPPAVTPDPSNTDNVI